MYKNNGLEYESEYEFQRMMDKEYEARKEAYWEKIYQQEMCDELEDDDYDD